MVLSKYFHVNKLPVEVCSVFCGKDSCAGLMKLDSDVCMIEKGLGWKTTPLSKLRLGLGSLSKASIRKCWSLLWKICGFRSWKAGNWLLLGCRDVWVKGLNVCDCLFLRAAFWNLERSPWPSTEVTMISKAISSINYCSDLLCSRVSLSYCQKPLLICFCLVGSCHVLPFMFCNCAQCMLYCGNTKALWYALKSKSGIWYFPSFY